MSRIALILALVAGLAGCDSDTGTPVEAHGNKDYGVQLLFEAEGCKVYAFYHAYNYRYFAKCDGGTHSTMWQERCGKNCTRHMAVTTDQRRG